MGSAGAGPRLELWVGEQLAASLAPGELCLLGRAAECGVVLDDPDASRVHAEVRHEAQGAFVSDLGSRNGTRHGGRPLAPNAPAPLVPGSLIEIGGVRLEVRAGAPRLRDLYEPLRQLGQGGHGSVFAARHRASGREVAIKSLHPQATDPALRERFRREGQVRIESPHVVPVLELRVEGDAVYLVSELMQGSLEDLLRARGRLSPAEALQACEHAARGLAAAHAQGVIHRDIKPANLLFDREGRLRLADFGIAKALEAEHASLTESGTGIGTLAYVSPEQIEDAKWVEPSTDLYALGATLYHALAGQPPLGSDDAEILASLFEREPRPLLELRPECPPGLAALVHALHAKEADERPQAAEVVERALALRAEWA